MKQAFLSSATIAQEMLGEESWKALDGRRKQLDRLPLEYSRLPMKVRTDTTVPKKGSAGALP